MRMRRYTSPLLMSLVVMFVTHLSAQVLTAERHLPCKTDTLLAYKLPYIAISDTGRNCLWDFSNLPTDSAEIIDVRYFAPSTRDTACIGLHREHTNNYCRYAQDTLWGTGYENSRTRVRYSCPMPIISFPFAYGDSLSGTFSGSGQYCHMLPLFVNGIDSVLADATGMLILPDLTIDTALRVHTWVQYQEAKCKQSYIKEDNYRWYSPYCRYPLLETVYIQTIKGQDTALFASSYYFPQEEEDNDSDEEKKVSHEEQQTDSLITGVQYLPNPVYSDLCIAYTLIRSARVYISLHYNGGVTTYQTPIHQEEEGSHTVSVNMAGLPIGTYVVYIHADDTLVSGNIIKL